MRAYQNHFLAELLYASPAWKAPKSAIRLEGFNALLCRLARLARPFPYGTKRSGRASLYSYRKYLKKTYPLTYTWLRVCAQRVRFANNAGVLDFSFHPFAPATSWPPATAAAFSLTYPPSPLDYLKARKFGTGKIKPLFNSRTKLARVDRAIITAYSYGLPLPAIAQILHCSVHEIDLRMASIVSLLMTYKMFALWALDGDYLIAIPPSLGRKVEHPNQRPIARAAKWWWRDEHRPLDIYLRLQTQLDAMIREAKLTVRKFHANLLNDLWHHPVIAAQIQTGEPLVRAWRWGERPNAS